jgi:hypothetical protein
MTQQEATPADDLRWINMAWVWPSVFVIVTLVGGLMSPWDAIRRGMNFGEQEGLLIAFVAGYTLPLTVGTAVVAFLALGRYLPEGKWTALVPILILALAGALSAHFGLGLAPSYHRWVSAPLPWSLLLTVLEGYFNSYGWALMICGVVIGCAAGLQLDRWLGPWAKAFAHAASR